MDWLEITINTKNNEIDQLCARLEDNGVEGVVIEDEAEYSSFLENNRKYWDYVDDELLDSWKGLSRVKFYFEDSDDGEAELSKLKKAMPEREFFVCKVKDEDWENNWKEYYKPVEIGKKLLIVPQWEEVPKTDGRAILRLDPGLIFGTGTHPTTKMCLEALENIAQPGKTVLDLGCGSGILAIAALIFGADKAYGCDIDPKAPDVAMENAALNNIYSDKFEVYAGDVISDKAMKDKFGVRRYDIITANIVADVIISICAQAKLWLKLGGDFVCSGIIGMRHEEVKAALIKCGFTVKKEIEDSDWYCYICS